MLVFIVLTITIFDSQKNSTLTHRDAKEVETLESAIISAHNFWFLSQILLDLQRRAPQAPISTLALIKLLINKTL